MDEAITIGLDIAKHVFHAHGADERGRALDVLAAKNSRTLPQLIRLLNSVSSPWKPVAERITGRGS